MALCCVLLAGCSKSGSGISTPSPTPFSSSAASPAATEQASEGEVSPTSASTDRAISSATDSTEEKCSETAPAQVQLQYTAIEVPATTLSSFSGGWRRCLQAPSR